MLRLSNFQIDILALAAESTGGAPLPAPESLSAAVAELLSHGLLVDEGGIVKISEEGRAAIHASAHRVLPFEQV